MYPLHIMTSLGECDLQTGHLQLDLMFPTVPNKGLPSCIHHLGCGLLATKYTHHTAPQSKKSLVIRLGSCTVASKWVDNLPKTSKIKWNTHTLFKSILSIRFLNKQLLSLRQLAVASYAALDSPLTNSVQGWLRLHLAPWQGTTRCKNS